MKFIFYTLLATLLLACGTLGTVQLYNFYHGKHEVEKKLFTVISDTAYSVPLKWKNNTGGYEFLQVKYIYFKSIPEEMYQCGFTGDSIEWNSTSACTLSLDGVFDGKSWRFEKDLNKKEEERIKKRFEAEILSKMGLNYYK